MMTLLAGLSIAAGWKRIDWHTAHCEICSTNAHNKCTGPCVHAIGKTGSVLEIGACNRGPS
jgi:hypothetical protein